MNLSHIWKTIKNMDLDVSNLYDEYIENKNNKNKISLNGKRSSFFNCTEFSFKTNDFSEHKKSNQQSVDGVYVISRIGFQVYVEGTSDITGNKVRESMVEDSSAGFINIINQNGGHFALSRKWFNFEWKLEIGSSERSYCVDKNSDGFMSSRTLLSSGRILSNEMEFSKPYILKGNESFTLSVRPIFYNPFTAAISPIDDRYIVSVTTIGHKIIGTDLRRYK